MVRQEKSSGEGQSSDNSAEFLRLLKGETKDG